MIRDKKRTVKECLFNEGYEGLVFQRSAMGYSLNNGRNYVIGNRCFDKDGAAIVEVNFVDEKYPKKERLLAFEILKDREVRRC